jgi:ATP-dependent 26S proteasome regulatory subunit
LDAIQRRFERSFLIDLPTYHERIDIFKIILKDTLVAENFSYEICAQSTEGYSASDVNLVSCVNIFFIHVYFNSKVLFKSNIRLITDVMF